MWLPFLPLPAFSELFIVLSNHTFTIFIQFFSVAEGGGSAGLSRTRVDVNGWNHTPKAYKCVCGLRSRPWKVEREGGRERALPLPFIANTTACLNKRPAKAIPGSGALCPNALPIFHHNVRVDWLFIDVGATESRSLLSWRSARKQTQVVNSRCEWDSWDTGGTYV